MRALDRIATLDFEASCLPAYGKSFPIEVALCSLGGDLLFSAMIRPPEEWASWDWDPAAARLHGLELDRLRAEGLDARTVVEALNCAAEGRSIVSDSCLDGVWLNVLADAAHLPAGFEIGAVDGVLTEIFGGAPEGGVVAAAAERAFRKFPSVHRAGPDAQRLAETLKLLASDHGLL